MSFTGNVVLAAGSSAAAWLAAPLVSAAMARHHRPAHPRVLEGRDGPIPLPRLDGGDGDEHAASARHA